MSVEQLERFTRNFPIDEFRHESEQIRRETMEKVQQFRAGIAPKIINDLGDNEAAKIKARGIDDIDKISLYTMFYIIYDFSEEYYPNHKVALRLKYKYRHYIVSSYHRINVETITSLNNLIKSLWYGEFGNSSNCLQNYSFADNIPDDSDKYKLATWTAWDSMSLYFERR